ncbi:MAG TPA: HAMP domain-containing protein [Gammaproteobacteria bacterium]|nr:HAMP domain-containing protein [Gammaproteobacteria bacterium]
MAIKALIKRFFSGNSPIAVVVVLLLTSLYLMSVATHNSLLFGRLYSVLLGINLLATILLVALIGKSVWHLIQQYRQGKTGSRLTTRLVIMFVVLSTTPVSVVYYFSLDFLQRGIDSWFDVRVENALNDALELSKASLGVRMRELLRQTQLMAPRLNAISNELTTLTLNELRNESGANELTLFTNDGQIIASSISETTRLLPQQLEDNTLQRLRLGQDDFGLVPIPEIGLHIRISINMASPDPALDGRILQLLYPITPRINELAENVQQAFSAVRSLTILRLPLKYSFILTLSLILLLSILTSIWAAFFAARRMVAPISDLVEGTRAVAAGNYEKRLPLPGKDELGFLVRSFNEMTQKIAMAQESARISQQQAETQHGYLESILGNLSSGVITLNSHNFLQTTNHAANQILSASLNPFIGHFLDDAIEDNPQLQQLVDAIYPHIEAKEKKWQEEVTLFIGGTRKILICRGTLITLSTHTEDLENGSIIVFDDVTELVKAQRNAAWGEVARRLAHEIKNPLTPIQLSAERIRHKYLEKMDIDDADILDRSTHTIVQQVETLKEMVKAFSDYARMPTLTLDTIDLNKIITEVLDLYVSSNNDTLYSVTLDSSNPEIEADIGRFRQLLHNLIKNALEANQENHTESQRETKDEKIYISTRCAEEHACRYVELKITDTGPGIAEDMFDQLFEPYVTTKPKGSGLGLAIVKKIVEEHGGMIFAENAKEGGASIIIRLPVKKTSSSYFEADNIKQDNDAAA